MRVHGRAGLHHDRQAAAQQTVRSVIWFTSHQINEHLGPATGLQYLLTAEDRKKEHHEQQQQQQQQRYHCTAAGGCDAAA